MNSKSQVLHEVAYVRCFAVIAEVYYRPEFEKYDGNYLIKEKGFQRKIRSQNKNPTARAHILIVEIK